MLRSGADRLSADAGRIDEAGRLADRLVLRREAGRDFGAADFGREVVRGLAIALAGLAAAVVLALAAVRGLTVLDAVLRDLVVLDRFALGRVLADRLVLVRAAVVAGFAAVARDVDRDFGRVVEALGLDAGLRLDAALGFAAARRAVLVRAVLLRAALLRAVLLRTVLLRAVLFRAVLGREALAAAGLAEDIVFAAAVRALAAVVMALVAVFIDCIAEDIVLADAVALVVAAVILLAAEVTLVAAEDMVLAAATGVAELRLAVLRRAALVREAPERAREAVERDAVDRDAVLRVDRDALLLDAGFAAERRAVVAAVLRAAVFGLALDDLELELDFGRLAVPLDALRLTDLRAVLAELRRLAARVVD